MHGYALSSRGTIYVVVWAWAGKEFPDMRQNEREIKLIRVGDAVRTGASSRENRHWTGVFSPLLYPGYKGWDRGLVDHLLIGWGVYTGWGKSRAIPSPYGVGAETGYTAQEDLKSVNNYNMVEGKMKRSVFSIPAFQDPLWFYLLFHPWVTT